MRRLVTLVCMGAVSTALVGVARGAEDAGMLSIERGKGAVVLEIRGVDLQPCGGTHVRTTREIGRVAVLKIESKGRQNRRVVVGFAE